MPFLQKIGENRDHNIEPRYFVSTFKPARRQEKNKMFDWRPYVRIKRHLIRHQTFFAVKERVRKLNHKKRRRSNFFAWHEKYGLDEKNCTSEKKFFFPSKLFLFLTETLQIKRTV
jgi:hypothetical protein